MTTATTMHKYQKTLMQQYGCTEQAAREIEKQLVENTSSDNIVAVELPNNPAVSVIQVRHLVKRSTEIRYAERVVSTSIVEGLRKFRWAVRTRGMNPYIVGADPDVFINTKIAEMDPRSRVVRAPEMTVREEVTQTTKKRKSPEEGEEHDQPSKKAKTEKSSFVSLQDRILLPALATAGDVRILLTSLAKAADSTPECFKMTIGGFILDDAYPLRQDAYPNSLTATERAYVNAHRGQMYASVLVKQKSNNKFGCFEELATKKALTISLNDILFEQRTELSGDASFGVALERRATFSYLDNYDRGCIAGLKRRFCERQWLLSSMEE